MSIEKIMEKKEKLTPKIESTITEMLGERLGDVVKDISDRLVGLDFKVSPSKTFKDAKLEFKKRYFSFLLIESNGNVSEVSRISGIDRRQIHRLIAEFNLDIEKMREQPLYFKERKTQIYVKTVFKDTLSSYDITKKRLETLNYELTNNLAKDLVDFSISYEDAKKLFEKEYFEALKIIYAGDLKKMANHAKISQVSVFRKIKEYKL